MDSQQPPNNKGFSSPFGQSDSSSSTSNQPSSIPNQVSSSQPNSFPTQSNQPTNQSFQMNNSIKLPKIHISKKWMMVGLAVGLFIGGVYIFGAVTSQNPQDLAKEFETAVYEGNTKKLASLIVSEDPKVKIDAESLKSFTAYLKEKEKYRNNLISSLQSTAIMYEQNSDILENAEYAEDGGGDAGYYDDIYLYRNEIPLYYDTYEIRIRPYQVAITTNEADTKIIVNNKEVFKTTSTQLTHVATVLPGKHDVKIAKDYDFWELTAAKEVVALDEPSGKIEVEIKSEGETTDLKSLYPQTKIVINGKQTNKLVKDFQKFGPVSQDGSMTISGETQMPWGVEKSFEENIKGVYYDLTPQTISGSVRKEVTNIINNYAKQQLTAKIQKNSKVFTNISDELKEYWIEEIDDIQYYTFSGKVHDCKIDFHKVKYHPSADENLINVQVPFQYHQTVSSKRTDWSGSNETKEEYKDVLADLQYNKTTKQWTVMKIYNFSEAAYSDFYMKNPDVIKTEFK